MPQYNKKSIPLDNQCGRFVPSCVFTQHCFRGLRFLWTIFVAVRYGNKQVQYGTYDKAKSTDNEGYIETLCNVSNGSH